MTTEPGQTPPVAPGHEPRDVQVRVVAIAAAILGAVIAVTFALMYGLLGALEARPGPQASPLAARYARSAPPEPRLQTDPRGDLQQLREAEEGILHRYGWVDRSAGRVRIPIERAMELLATRAGRAPDEGRQ